MPVVSVILDEVDKSIHTKIESKIINDIASKIKLPDDILLIKHGGNDLVITDAKGNRSINEDPNTPTTSSKKRMLVSVSNEYQEDDVATAAIHQRSAYPIFVDNEVGLQIYPVYIRNVLKIEFSYITNSLSEAKRIRDYIRLGLSQTRSGIMHDVDYTIIIPRVVEELIADVYDLKSRLYPQTLESYFNQHSTNRIELITDMANEDNKRLAINEKQTRIIGQFEFNPIPEKVDSDMETSNYKLSFNYEVTMDIPRAIVMRYPVMLCNSLMPNKYLEWISDHKRNSYIERNRPHNYTSFHNYNLSMLESHQMTERYVDTDLPIVVPDFDDFEPRFGHKGFTIISSLLTTVDETDKRSLFNLKDLGDEYHVTKEILKYLENGEHKYITTPYNSFMYIGVWQEDRYFDAGILSVDKDLNVKSTRDLDLTKPTRITLSLCIDLTNLPSSTIDRLVLDHIFHIEKYKEYFETILPNTPNNPPNPSNPSATPVFDPPRTALEIVMGEYINIQNSIKNDLSNHRVPEQLTTEILVSLIRPLILRDYYDSVRNIFDLIKESFSVIYNRLIIYLSKYYSELYALLIKWGILPDVDPSKGNLADIRHRVPKVKKKPWGEPSWIIIPLRNSL